MKDESLTPQSVRMKW